LQSPPNMSDNILIVDFPANGPKRIRSAV